MNLGSDYTELKRLGSGATGHVTLTRHEPTGLLLAVKHLSPRLAGDPLFRARFRAEADRLRRVRHPSIAAQYWYIQTADEAALGVELINGVSLRRLLQQGALPPEAALLVLRGSLLGLRTAHAVDVVHRDVKPENIMVDGEGTSRLIDFGIAAPADHAGAAGTPQYMAPELWQGEGASPSTDVYAAAAVLFECLTGHVPFAGTTASALRDQHLSAAVPLEAIPEPVRELVARVMAKDPSERFASAGACAASLEIVAAHAYGDEWTKRGAAALAAAALDQAALFPLGHGGAAAEDASGIAEATARLAAPPASTVDASPLPGLLAFFGESRRRQIVGACIAVLAVAAVTAFGITAGRSGSPAAGVAGAYTVVTSPPTPSEVGSSGPAPSTPSPSSGTSTSTDTTDTIIGFSAPSHSRTTPSPRPSPAGGPPPSPPVMTLSAGSMDFGSQNVGGTSPAQVLTVRNAGGSTLHPSMVNWAGTFTVTHDGCSGGSLTSGQTCAISVAFTPTAPGSASGTLTVSADSSPPTASVSLTGTGTTPAASVSPTALTFSGSNPGPFTVIVTSDGSGTLGIGSIVLSGPDAGSFQIQNDSCSGMSLAPGDNCSFDVEAAPASTTLSAEVQVFDDAGDSPQTITLSAGP